MANNVHRCMTVVRWGEGVDTNPYEYVRKSGHASIKFGWSSFQSEALEVML